MIKVGVKFEEKDLAMLDRQAAHQNVNRSELIRRRVLGETHGGQKNFSPRKFQELVSSAHRRSNMPRAQVEQLVAFVFCEVMDAPPVEATPGS